MKTVETKEITTQDLKNVRAGLKKLSQRWAPLLAKKMFPEESDPDKAKDKIYNLVSGNSRSQDMRRLFVVKAAELKAELEIEQNGVNNLVKELTTH